MSTINVTKVGVQKDALQAEAGKVGQALVEWGAPEGLELHRKIVKQEELSEQARKGYDAAKQEAAARQAEATQFGQVLDATLEGALALMKLHGLGEVPALTDFFKADRYAFADELASRLESAGSGEAIWLSESVRKAKRTALHAGEKQRAAAAAFAAAGRGYQAAVGRLKLLVQEAKLVLRASLVADAPALRHLKRKPKEKPAPAPVIPVKPAA